MKNRQTSMDIPLGKINPAEKKHPLMRTALFLTIQNEWGNGLKEVPRK
jgi:hypothetical protein